MKPIIFFKLFFAILAPLCTFASGCSPEQPPAELDNEAEIMEASLATQLESQMDDFFHLPEFPLVAPGEELPVTAFREVWAYLVAGRENALYANLPISDLVYFGAELDTYGKLVNVPDIRRVSRFNGRVHLVVACNGRALTYFALAEGRPEREALIRDLIEAAGPYHGLQIDFEYVPSRSADAFLSFLTELRAGLGDKIFSVALAARTRTLQDDVYDYRKILPIADRILVMAYDEHWSSSAPGPIASMGWSQRVARYAIDTIGPEKLIMGLPFYGRSWGNANMNRAYLHSGIEDLKNEQNITEIRHENGIPTFNFEIPLSVTVYYEDEHSLANRLDMYKSMGVNAVGFWRLGQETPAFWPYIALE